MQRASYGPVSRWKTPMPSTSTFWYVTMLTKILSLYNIITATAASIGCSDDWWRCSRP